MHIHTLEGYIQNIYLVEYPDKLMLLDGCCRADVDTVFDYITEQLKRPITDLKLIVVTHMHPDHIGGMTTDGAETFAKARYITGRQEFDFWRGQDKGNRVGDLMAQKVTPFAEKLTFMEDGDSVASGISAMASFGHTPGHMGYMLESGGQQLMLTADLANHYVWSFAHPDWEVKFDMDKEAATRSRRRILDMLASTGTPMIGYHMPFPAAGYVETRDSGFRFVPVSYQMMG